MKLNIRRIIGFVLLAAMCLSMTACGSTNADKTDKQELKAEETPEFVYTAEYTDVLKDTKDYMYIRYFDGNAYYATSYEKAGTNAPEGAVEEIAGQYDVYKSYVYRIVPGKAPQRLEGYVPLEAEQNTEGLKEFYSGADISGIIFTDDGFVTMESVYKSWNENDDSVPMYSDEYWEGYKYETTYYVRWFDKDGNEKSISVIPVPNGQYISGYNMKLDRDNNIIVVNDMGLRAIAPDGTESYTVECDDYVDGLIQTSDGNIYAVIYGNEQMMYRVDPDTHELTDGKAVSVDAYSAITGNKEYSFIYTNGSNLYGCRMDNGESEKILSWLSCDVNGNSIYLTGMDDNGTVTGIISNWNQSDETYDYESVTIRKVPYSSVAHKQTLTMAVMYLDYELQDMLVNFNRRNDSYRIEVADYSEYNRNWNGEGENPGLTKLNTEIMSGKVPDIFCLQGLNYTQLASKGILEDLYPYIDADSELSRADFFPNVLKAQEVNGKLCSTISGFFINSVIGASAIVGDEPGWNYDEFNAALASMPNGCTAFDKYVTRFSILQSCLALDMAQFVNWSTGECRFNSEDFISLLEFAKSFPAEYDWETDPDSGESTEDRLAQGKQMLVETSAYSIDDIFYNNYTQFMGGKITYVGYPTASGTGNMISLAGSGYAMSAKSQYKDEVWKFLREFMTKDYQEDLYSLSSRIDVFEKKAEKAMTVEYQKDGSGNYILDKDGEKVPIAKTTIWNAQTRQPEKIYALTAEQVDQIRQLVLTTTKVADYNSNIFDIVNKQVGAFFDGQKSAADVAKLIQSEASIYVNEQR